MIRVSVGSISSVDGSAVVRIGGACVVCGIRMVSAKMVHKAIL